MRAIVRSATSRARSACSSARAPRRDVESHAIDSGTAAASAEKLALLDHARETLKEAFGAASADALRANNDAFLQLARTSLEKTQERAAADLTAKHTEIAGLVQPIRDSLAKISDHVHQVDRDGSPPRRR